MWTAQASCASGRRSWCPIAAPGMASLAMVVFLWNWNNYLDPLVFLTNWRLYTIPIALTNFIEESVTEYNLVMAASARRCCRCSSSFWRGRSFCQGSDGRCCQGIRRKQQ